MTTASASSNKVEVIVSEDGQQGLPGVNGTNGAGFNSVRKSKIDNPLLHILKKNKLEDAISGSITWTRSTAATYVDIYGIVRVAAIDTPREEMEGWLIEGVSTNLWLRSEEFSNASWNKLGCTITENATVAPDLSVSADKIVESAVNEDHRINQSFAVSGAGDVTVTVFVQAAERTVVQLVPDSVLFGVAHANFDLSTKTVSASSGTVTADIVELRSGIFRVRATFTSSGAGASGAFISLADSSTMPRLASYSGDGVSGLFVWGAQVEEIGFATSYIKTVAAGATRTADSVTLPGVDNSPLPNKNLSWFFNYSILGDGVEHRLCGMEDFDFFYFAITSSNEGRSVNGVTIQAPANLLKSGFIAYTQDSSAPLRTIYKDSTANIATSDSNVYAINNGSVPTFIQLGDSAHTASTSPLYGHLSDFRVYDFALNADEVQFLSGE